MQDSSLAGLQRLCCEVVSKYTVPHHGVLEEGGREKMGRKRHEMMNSWGGVQHLITMWGILVMCQG